MVQLMQVGTGTFGLYSDYMYSFGRLQTVITDKVGKVDTEIGTGGTERTGLDGKVIDTLKE